MQINVYVVPKVIIPQLCFVVFHCQNFIPQIEYLAGRVVNFKRQKQLFLLFDIILFIHSLFLQ